MLQPFLLLLLLQLICCVSDIEAVAQPPFRGEFGAEPRGLGLLYSITSSGTVGVSGQNQNGDQIQNALSPGTTGMLSRPELVEVT